MNSASKSVPNWVLPVIILTITLLVFYPAFNYDFVNWDDNHVVIENPMIQDGLQGDRIKEAFTTPHVWGQYFPVTLISFMANVGNGELDPARFHRGNILLHLANVLLRRPAW